MYDQPKHQKDWLNNIRPSPASRGVPQSERPVQHMKPAQILININDGVLQKTEQVFRTFVSKCKDLPESPMKQFYRQETLRLFPQFIKKKTS